MVDFSINTGGTTTFTDTTPDGGFIIDFVQLDNGFNAEINGVELFVGGPGTAPNELEFQTSGTEGQTVRFADGDFYGTDTDEIWELGRAIDPPTEVILRLQINPDGTIELFGVKTDGGPLVSLELINGLTVNTAAIDAAWNDNGSNTIVIGQDQTGPTDATGEFIDVVCFASGTLIETSTGPVRVDDLSVTDEVLTYDNGYQPIRWIGSCSLTAAQLEAQPAIKPIRISAGALGEAYPKQDLIVSPQHRVLVSSSIAMRMFESQDVLIPANKFLAIDGVETLQDTPDGVTYFHMLFDAHQLIWSNGTPTESLFTGPEALKSVSDESRQEIKALFPACLDPDFAPLSARYIPKQGKRMRKLVERHQINDKPLFDGRRSL